MIEKAVTRASQESYTPGGMSSSEYYQNSVNLTGIQNNFDERSGNKYMKNNDKSGGAFAHSRNNKNKNARATTVHIDMF